MNEWQNLPHARLNPLTGEWLLVSPQRTNRPWQGQVERGGQTNSPAYDPTCYLCPGNERASGHRNPAYTTTFAFDNDFPGLLPDTPLARSDEQGLMVAESERGITRVLCFSPTHNLTISRMEQSAVENVVAAWREENARLAAFPWIDSIQIFENRGEMMGASSPHPHCQIWANRRIPNEIAKERDSQRNWLRNRGQCLLCEYMALEQNRRERIVTENELFVVLVPFWALWPFETLVLAKRHFAGLADMTSEECAALASILREVAIRYDNLFQAPCPYSMGFHQQPLHDDHDGSWHFHAHYYPPVLRSATVRKFMVGYELLAMPQRDITAENAAARLHSLPSIHYLDS